MPPRHHNVVGNRTKSTKHMAAPAFENFNAPATGDGSGKRSDSLTKKSMKYYQLPNVPLYHAAHGQMMYRTNESFNDSIRNRSSIQKRASQIDWLSRNISMVLEQLLMHYENSYLPTHGQGTTTVRYWIRHKNCVSFQAFRRLSKQTF